jgi:hypothetical protein
MVERTASALVAVENSAQRAATTSEDIPDVSHPKWQQLMTDDLKIDSKALGLYMLLARVRIMMLQNPTEAERRA